jgi:subtilase family serine protease
MRIAKYVLAAFVIAIFFPRLSHAATPDRISGALNIGPTVTLHGNAHRAAQARYDQGLVDPALRLGYITLLTMPSVQQQKALKELVAQQQDPKSSNYHKWLTPEQWADRFGLSRGDVQNITDWLKSEGFRLGNVARGRNWISFGGTAAQVQRAFGTEVHHFNVNGEMHVGNSGAPRIPAALAGIVAGLRGLDDFHLKPKVDRPRSYFHEGNMGLPDFLAPGDIATMYGIDAFFNASPAIDGTGQKLVVVGQTDIFLTDINDFRAAFGLTPISGCTSDSTTGLLTGCSATTNNFQYVLVPNAPDPHAPSRSDLAEADLDLEWSGAVAGKAKIIYVNAPAIFDNGGNLVSGGIWDAWYYAIDQNLAPVISMSYGKCEWKSTLDLTTTDEIELLKANSQGITFVSASGDSGAAECDPNGTDPNGASATGGWAVSYPASSPEVTGVGGTAIPLSNFSSQYWGTSNGPDGGSALSYVPEQAMNDDAELAQWCTLVNPTDPFCSQGGNTPVPGWIPITSEQTAQRDIGVLSSGGGASNCAVQNQTFTACVSGFPQPSWQTVTIPNQPSGRFSPDIALAASPAYPGYILCTPQEEAVGGNSTTSTCVNGISGPSGALELYNSRVGGTSAATAVFAGIVTLLNQYLNGPSSRGLGNINPMLYQLAETAPAAFHPVTTGDNFIFCQPGTGEPGAPACPPHGVLGFGASDADATTGYNLVTGLGSVDTFRLAQAWAANLSFTLSASPASLTAVAGQNSNTSTITVTPQNGFGRTVTLSCSAGLPAGATCNFTTLNSRTSTLVIQTAAMTPVTNVAITVKGTSGSLLSTTSVSLTVTPTAENFSLTSNLGANGTLSVTQGTSGDVSLTVNSSTGFVITNGGHSSTALPLTYSCSGLPSGSSCNFSPSNPSSHTLITLSISTAPPSARLLKPVDPGLRVLYAALLPGLVGIVFTFDSRKRSLRGIGMLGLIIVVGFSTLGLGSCGGYGITSLDPGKPKASYSITVNATTGGANPVTAQTAFTLQVT